MTRGLAGGRAGLGLAGLALLGALAGCATDSAGAESGEQASSGTGTATEVRLGYFPNLTHATGIVGVEQGLFTKELESANATPKFQVFDSGTEVIEAMLSGALDVSYIGPSPTLTGYAQSNGAALRIVSGGFRRRRADRQPEDLLGRGPWRDDPGNSVAREHPRRRPAVLPQAPRLPDDDRRWR